MVLGSNSLVGPSQISTFRWMDHCTSWEVLLKHASCWGIYTLPFFICSLQEKEFPDLGKPCLEQQLLSNIKCSLPSVFDSLLFAWGSVPLVDQTLTFLQTRAPCFRRNCVIGIYQLRYPLIPNYCTKWARRSPCSSETPLPVLQVRQAECNQNMNMLMSAESPSLFLWIYRSMYRPTVNFSSCPWNLPVNFYSLRYQLTAWICS